MIEVLSCGPLITVQDRGRPGNLGKGLARGGAADRRALTEAAALLGGDAGAGLELPGVPLRLRIDADIAVALTGAAMRATVDGAPFDWNTSATLAAGAVLDLRPKGPGVYSYVHVKGGIDAPVVMGSRAAHLIAGIGAVLRDGDRLACGGGTATARRLTVRDRMTGGTLRMVATPQTPLFPGAEIERFLATEFTRDPRGNRQGVRLAMEGPGFATEGQLSLLSDFILPGDIQMTGEGVPYILGPECQTTGGYPRIGTVIAADLPRALQAGPGAKLRFELVTPEAARAAAEGTPRVERSIRNPAERTDLMSLQLIDGVISAKDGTSP